MVYAVVISVLWIIGLIAFIWSVRRHPEIWYNESSAKNWKYKLVSTVLGLLPAVLLLWFAVLVSDKEHKEAEEKLAADIEMRENRFASLDTIILNKFNEIGLYYKDVSNYNQLSPHFELELMENGISHHSKLIAMGLDKNGLIPLWMPFNESLLEKGYYSEDPDSLNYIVCISGSEITDYYGSGKLHTSTTEVLFVQLFDFNTNVIVDTFHFDENRNPMMVRVKNGSGTHEYHGVQPEELLSRIFR